MIDKPTLLISQLLIALMMSLSMSGIMSLLALGPSADWLRIWPRQFVIAWPIAFLLSLFISRFGFFLAERLMSLRTR